jgi:hypothetical protein
MNLLPVGDSTKWIDLDKATKFDLKGQGMLYLSGKGDWIYVAPGQTTGTNISADDAYKRMMQLGLYQEAQKQFPEQFKGGEL